VGDKLPVGSTIWQSLRAGGHFVARYPGLFCLLIAMEFASREGIRLLPQAADSVSLRSFLWDATLSLLVAAFSAPIIVAAHRSVLTVDESASYEFHSHRTRFFAIAAVACLLVFEANALSATFPVTEEYGIAWWMISVPFFIATLVLGIRVLLALPLIAIDQAAPFRRSIAMTKGRWWRITAITMIPAFVVTAALAMLDKVTSWPPPGTHLADLATALANAFIDVVPPCALSFTYLWIRDHEAAVEASATAALAR
jgi:hypothetical protein